jgi:hypothetical protein
MSGYTDDAALGPSFPDPDLAFLKKPFTPAGLTRKIREVLEKSERGMGAAVQ